MSVLIVAGEHSGDIYAAKLAQAIHEQSPETKLFGLGGSQLLAHTDQFISHITHQSSIGFIERWFVKNKKNYLDDLEKVLKTTAISRAIIVDFQHENFKLASLFSTYDIPVTTFITPNFWMWNDVTQMKKLAAYSDHIITIFKTEFDRYACLHPNVHFFGHPIKPEATVHVSERDPIISLFPGSRIQEISLLLPIMLKTCAQFRGSLAEYEIHLCVSSPDFEPMIQRYLKKFPSLDITLRTDSSALIKESRVMLSCTGTATLEAVACNTPVLVLGKLHALSYLIAKYMLRIKIPYVALPNIIMQARRVPELVQNQVNPEQITQELRQLLTTPETATKHYPSIQDRAFSSDDIFEKSAAIILQ